MVYRYTYKARKRGGGAIKVAGAANVDAGARTDRDRAPHEVVGVAGGELCVCECVCVCVCVCVCMCVFVFQGVKI